MRRTFDEPDERRTLAGGRVVVDVVRLGELPALRVSHAPGWRWSEHSALGAGRDRCPGTHVGIVVSGRLGIEEVDGTVVEARAGDVVAILPGHDAWTIGDDSAVLVQFDEGESAARRFGLAP